MRYFFVIFFLLSFIFGYSQPTAGLIAYYNFDDCLATDFTGNNANTGIINGSPSCECGVQGDALRFDGLDDQIIFPGPVNDEFGTTDFTVSFYFKPSGATGTQDILSKRDDCSSNNAFAIRYTPASKFINVVLSENSSKSASISERLDFNRCWHHIVVVRKGTKTILYVDGTFRQKSSASSRVDVSNGAFLSLANSPCQNTTDRPFEGLIDEIRIYSRALSEVEVPELFVAPDLIANRDTLLFLGNSVDIHIPNTCATDFSWNPTDGVISPSSGNTLIEPVNAGVLKYTVTMSDNICLASDTIRISVIDPADLDCNQIFLPKAFTPNNDGLNETFGISNPFAVERLLAFEIFDRWGSRIFYTEDPFERWDGSFRGDPLNPGVFLYKMRYACKGEEKVIAGSLSLIR
ncbi:MAG: T9SS type B sorting domain-containing protein [Bacteroidetes bacterium]|nr:T9SS type B sorting domain-containing protein [Bacteroidota bacterium]